MAKIIKTLIFANLINIFACGSVIAFEVQNENTTNIKNKIETRAETGANIPGNGELNEGNSSAKIKIKTEINGNTVTDIDESKKSGGNAELKVENEVKADSQKAEVKTFIYGSEGSETKENTIEFNNATNNNMNLNGEEAYYKNEELGISDFEEPKENEQGKDIAITDDSDSANNSIFTVVLSFLADLKNKIINFFV